MNSDQKSALRNLETKYGTHRYTLPCDIDPGAFWAIFRNDVVYCIHPDGISVLGAFV